MSFSTWCDIEVGKANSDINYIGAVCRFNEDDGLMVQVRNDEYGKAASKPVAASDRLDTTARTIARIQPVRELLVEEWKPAFETSEENEVRYLTGIHQAIESGQAGYRPEAEIRARAIGLEVEEAERSIRRERLADVARKLAKAREDVGKASHKIAASRHALTLQVDKEYGKLHGNAVRYPPEYVRSASGSQAGGHAEENLIRIWASITSGITLEKVDLFITRMPCPDKSSGFSMDGTVYKEGCMNKLIQLVSATGSGVTWAITYYQRLSVDQEALALAFAKGFPGNATIALRS